MFLKIAAWTSAAEDFLNIFLSFFGFWGSFFYKRFPYKKRVISKPDWTHKPYLSECLNYCRVFYYPKNNRAFRRKIDDISLLFEQRNGQIHILILVEERFPVPQR